MEKQSRMTERLLAENEKLRSEIASLQGKGCRLLGPRKAIQISPDNHCVIVNSVQDAIYVLDPAGEILSLNPAWETITGFQREEWIGKTFGPLVHPDDLPRVAAHFAKAAAGEASPTYEARFITPSGEYKMGHFANAPHLRNGKVIAVVGIARDITDLKQQEETRLNLERRMQESQKLESLGVLAGGIAHDLNNLLMGILGNADLALIGARDKKSVTSRLEDIKLTAIRLSDLTNQMLAYSGQGTFAMEATDLTRIAREMGRLLEVSLPKKANLHFDLLDNIPPIKADARQLQQVILNLLTNAAESRGSDAVDVSVRTALFTADRAWLAESITENALEEGEHVLLEVSDTGLGMDETTRKRIFDPFFTTKFTGRGLGLAAVLGIVRSHEGAIRVRSAENQGSCFQILFPTTDEDAVQSDRDKEFDTLSWRGEGTILLVDDDPIVLDVAKLMLEEAGFQVITAGDGVEAVEAVQAHKDGLDAVLLDVTMPRMDGIEACAQIRTIRPDLKVVFSSGYNEREACQRFKGTGIDGFLKKPYRYESLTQTLRMIFES